MVYGNEPIIKVENIGMTYRRPLSHKGRFGLVRDLMKREYEEFQALSNISFNVSAGDILGYLGPNGAGKSTTIKIITGVMHPTTGSVYVNGVVPHENRIANGKNIALISGQRTNLYWDLPVRDSFELNKRIYKISDYQYQENIALFESLLKISRFIDVPVRQLSLGQRIMSDFCLALLHNPSVIFLDEPTIGLDITAKESIIKFLRYINEERNVTILITSHDLSDIEKLCNNILIIDRGHKIFEGEKQKLISEYCQNQCTIFVELESAVSDYQPIIIPQTTSVKSEVNRLEIAFDRTCISPSQIISNIISTGSAIRDFSLRETTLEDAIKILYLKK